jgi:UDP-N-acetylglucosamine 4,6-dehydratase
MRKVFITGGSGTVGSTFIEKYYGYFKFYSYCRNESMQVALKRRLPDVDILLGSVEDSSSVLYHMSKVSPDIIIHAAALKHVDIAEKQPSIATEVNVIGSLNIIKAAIENGVSTVVGISTDKACNPDNVYGYTKLMMEKMFVDANFTCCRFGNVAKSQGSVIPFWTKLKDEGKKLKVTDPEMTRLMFSKSDAVELINYAVSLSEVGKSGFVLSCMMKSVNLLDLAQVISNDIEVVGLRPGEKIHESLISEREVSRTEVNEEGYIFLHKEKKPKQSRLPSLSEELSSLTAEKMSENEMKQLVTG